MPRGVAGVTSRPSSIRSGSPLASLAPLQHRSSVVLQEFRADVAASRARLRRLRHLADAQDVVDEADRLEDEALIMLKVMEKITKELEWTRTDMHTAVAGENIDEGEALRSRVHWIESRIQKLSSDFGSRIQRETLQLLDRVTERSKRSPRRRPGSGVSNASPAQLSPSRLFKGILKTSSSGDDIGTRIAPSAASALLVGDVSLSPVSSKAASVDSIPRTRGKTENDIDEDNDDWTATPSPRPDVFLTGFDPEEDFIIDQQMRMMVSDEAIERALRRYHASKRRRPDGYRPAPLVRIEGAAISAPEFVEKTMIASSLDDRRRLDAPRETPMEAPLPADTKIRSFLKNFYNREGKLGEFSIGDAGARDDADLTRRMRDEFRPVPIPPPEVLTVARLRPGEIYPKGSGHYRSGAEFRTTQQPPPLVPLPDKPDARLRLFQRDRISKRRRPTAASSSTTMTKKDALPPSEDLSALLLRPARPLGRKSPSSVSSKSSLSAAGSLKRGVGRGTASMAAPPLPRMAREGPRWRRVLELMETFRGERLADRINAVKHLGAIMTGDDPEVAELLRSAVESPEADSLLRYECAKTLIRMGRWEEGNVAVVVEQLRGGTVNARKDVIATVVKGKEVYRVDESLPSYPLLVDALNAICRPQETADADTALAFSAAACLGKLGVNTPEAEEQLRRAVAAGNKHAKAEALEILVRQMSLRDESILDPVLDQVRNSAHWKYRKAGCRLLTLIGGRGVNKTGSEKAFYVLERQTWDEPNADVRREVAATLKSLKLIDRATERCVKKLEDRLERNREEAVATVATLGVDDEGVVKTLLDLLELDASVQVRVRVVRALVQLGATDASVVKSLERARGARASNSLLAAEATRALEAIEGRRRRRRRKEDGDAKIRVQFAVD